MAVCKNCGYTGDGAFCCQCGQKYHIHADPTLHDLVHDGIHEFLHLDGKIFRTLRYLFTTPGFLTLEFLRGRRASYIHPLRIYLTLSLIYLLIPSFEAPKTIDTTSVDSIKVLDIKNESKKDKSQDISISNKDNDLQVQLDLDTGTFIDQKLKELEPVFKQGLQRIAKDQRQFSKIYFSTLAKALFLLMPLFAFILKLTYWRRKQSYPQYLYFSFHYHAALFGGLIITTLLEMLLIDTAMLWLVWAFLYLVLSFKRVWLESTKRALQRATLVLALYSICFLIVAGVIGGYAIYQLGLQTY